MFCAVSVTIFSLVFFFFFFFVSCGGGILRHLILLLFFSPPPPPPQPHPPLYISFYFRLHFETEERQARREKRKTPTSTNCLSLMMPAEKKYGQEPLVVVRLLSPDSSLEDVLHGVDRNPRRWRKKETIYLTATLLSPPERLLH